MCSAPKCCNVGCWLDSVIRYSVKGVNTVSIVAYVIRTGGRVETLEHIFCDQLGRHLHLLLLIPAASFEEATLKMAPMNTFRIAGVAVLCTDVYIFARWHFRPKVDRDPNDKSGRPPPEDPVKLANHVKYMNDNWTVSLRNLREGRWWTMVTSAFSHGDLFHILCNMWGLVQAYRVMKLIRFSTPRTIALGLGSAVAGSAVYLWERSTRPTAKERETPGVGSSAMITGMFAASAMAVPNLPMRFPIVDYPFQLRTMVLAFAAFDVVGLVWERLEGMRQRKVHPLVDQGHSVAYAAHLGGTVFGAVFYAVALRKYRGRVVFRR